MAYGAAASVEEAWEQQPHCSEKDLHRGHRHDQNTTEIIHGSVIIATTLIIQVCDGCLGGVAELDGAGISGFLAG